jgi:general L-amino acid transport system permease protein
MATAPSARPPLWRDIRVLRVAGQIGAVLVVFLVLRWLFNNLITNLDNQGISRDFDFLDQPTNFTVRDSHFNPRDPVWEMLGVGVKNTFLAAIVGIGLAAVIGVLVGVGRLSTNWLVARLCTLYVETLRNIPPLVIIIFFGFAIFTFGPFPILAQANEYELPGAGGAFLIVSNERWGIASLVRGENSGVFFAVVAVAVVAAAVVWVWRTRLNLATGRPHRRILLASATFLGIAGAAYAGLGLVDGTPLFVEWAELSENRRRIASGFAFNAGYMSVTFALGLYTSTHIAEILRGSILAVPRGQSEASNALGLTSFQRYRFVVLPQALRIAVPPTINQFLNLTKNTSLATAVAYPEITALTKTSIGNGRPAPQSILILMVIYLVFSLVISFFLNLYNRRLAVVEQ